MIKKYAPFFWGGALILLDQAIKWWVIKHPLFVVKNQGLILGFGPTLDLIFWSVLCLILVLALFTIESPAKYIYSLIPMLAGSFSNLVDRIFRDGVIDYLKLPFFNLAFNLADLFLICGVITYAYQVFRNKQRRGDSSTRL